MVFVFSFLTYFTLWHSAGPSTALHVAEECSTVHVQCSSWETPWTQEPGGLWSMGWQRVRRALRSNSSGKTYIFIHPSVGAHSCCFRVLAIVFIAAVYRWCTSIWNKCFLRIYRILWDLSELPNSVLELGSSATHFYSWIAHTYE